VQVHQKQVELRRFIEQRERGREVRRFEELHARPEPGERARERRPHQRVIVGDGDP